MFAAIHPAHAASASRSASGPVEQAGHTSPLFERGSALVVEEVGKKGPWGTSAGRAATLVPRVSAPASTGHSAGGGACTG